MRITTDIEEMSVKEFKTVVQKLQTSLKREKQLHTMKAINEKNKSVRLQNRKSSTVRINSYRVICFRNQPEVWDC